MERGKQAVRGEASVSRVEKVELGDLRFDGQKPDVYINTGRLNGQHYLVRVADARGEPTLIAIHL